MDSDKIYTAIGLMSGTSLDGIDAALLKTDGQGFVECGPSLTIDYDSAFQDRLRGCLGISQYQAPSVKGVEQDLTSLHVEAVTALLQKAKLTPADIDLVGFHGHTVHHDAKAKLTIQLGDGARLADELGMAVVSNLRTADVQAGGEGAPLVPIYHAALVRAQSQIPTPVAIVNIGGVANVTWIGQKYDDLWAFDTGPGNAPLNDWIKQGIGIDLDFNGEHAGQGHIDETVLKNLLSHPYFDRTPPKSLDRQDFKALPPDTLNLNDGAATLTAFIARAIATVQKFFPEPAQMWIITGGGRKNPILMKGLEDIFGNSVQPVEAVGWDGDAMEAQAFAYLAVRHKLGLAITFPNTTGVKTAITGGELHEPYKDLSR